jgi:hypothetical protein
VGLTVLAVGCSTHGTAQQSSKTTPTTTRQLTHFEQQIVAELAYPPLGQTNAERRCWAPVLASGAATLQDALDKTAPYKGPGSAFRALAPQCTSATRAKVLDEAYARLQRRTLPSS